MELLPEAQWRAPSRVLSSAAAREQAPEAAGAEGDAANADAEPDGGHIAQVLRLCMQSGLGCLHDPDLDLYPI